MKKIKRLKKEICEQVTELLEPALQNIDTACGLIPESHPDFCALEEVWNNLVEICDRYYPDIK